jgi:hypothetical protein
VMDVSSSKKSTQANTRPGVGNLRLYSRMRLWKSFVRLWSG